MKTSLYNAISKAETDLLIYIAPWVRDVEYDKEEVENYLYVSRELQQLNLSASNLVNALSAELRSLAFGIELLSTVEAETDVFWDEVEQIRYNLKEVCALLGMSEEEEN